MPFLPGLPCLLAGVGRDWGYSFVLMDFLRRHGPHLGAVTRNLQRGASTSRKHSLTPSTDLAFGHFPVLAFKTRLNSTQSSQSHRLLITNIIQEALKSNRIDSISMKTRAALSTPEPFLFSHYVLIKPNSEQCTMSQWRLRTCFNGSFEYLNNSNLNSIFTKLFLFCILGKSTAQTRLHTSHENIE